MLKFCLHDSHIDVREEGFQAAIWLTRYALPLWMTTGYDASCGLFHERLTMVGTPLTHLPRRLMVQCRQLYVLAHATLLGVYDGKPLLQRTFNRVLDCYHTGKTAGWVFSVYS